MGDDDRQTWSLRAIARASGLTADTAVSVARAGLVPGYEGSSRSGAGISSELAEDLVKVMADRCYTIPFANLIKTDPERALLTVKALERITLASIEHSREAATGEAAA